MNILLAILFSFSLYASSLNLKEAWRGISSPLLMGLTYEIRLALLPTQGTVQKPENFWSGDYWPMYKGNIDYRWNASENFSIPSPDIITLKKMGPDEISQLSPAEKFDLLNGRYDYPLKNEIAKLTNYDAKKWEGICHGWAPASMNHKEPEAKTLRNPDGILIPFGSADIKAILSYYYAYPYQVLDTHQMGRRCDSRVINRDEDCKQDLNAGAFHIVLTNRIGIQNEGFVVDMDRFKQVWNHPVLGFSSRIKSEGRARSDSARGTTRTVKYSTTITYVDESVNSWSPLLGTREQKVKTQEMNYIVEVNICGEIIGGVWTSVVRPDFLWVKQKPQSYLASYRRLPELLND